MNCAAQPRVAVIGAGILGASVALLLARRGCPVVLIDAAAEPFSGASRWNEGKIHLGHLYAADPSLQTAQRLLPGGLSFGPLVEDILGCAIAPAVTRMDDVYLVHRDSVVSADRMQAYFETLTRIVADHPGAKNYLADISSARIEVLSRQALEAIANPDTIQAGFRAPERSVSTCWIADRYLDALRSEPSIAMAMDTRVVAIEPAGAARWRVKAEAAAHAADGLFDVVVNASWEGRLAIDRSLGLTPEPGWSHRYRQSLFVRTRRPVEAPCAVIATGPFGDVKNYNGRDFYLSWYPLGLRAEGDAVTPPPVAPLDDAARRERIDGFATTLEKLLPSVGRVMAEAESVRLEGGWVFAMGRGSLADPRSSLHRRDRFGILQHGSYFSVDTGKYSTAPLLATQIADRIRTPARAFPKS